MKTDIGKVKLPYLSRNKLSVSINIRHITDSGRA